MSNAQGQPVTYYVQVYEFCEHLHMSVVLKEARGFDSLPFRDYLKCVVPGTTLSHHFTDHGFLSIDIEWRQGLKLSVRAIESVQGAIDDFFRDNGGVRDHRAERIEALEAAMRPQELWLVEWPEYDPTV